MVNETFSILRILIENQDNKFSIRRLSQLRKINYKSAYQAIMKLEKEGIANLERFGNIINCSFNRKFNPLVFAVEYERRNDLFKNKNFLILNNRLSELKFPFIALLFGSHAKRTANKHSDIDILAIGEDEKEIKFTLSLLPDKIHLTNVTYEEFIHMAKSREFSVVSEAIKNNIILVGIEEYYRLLSNAG